MLHAPQLCGRCCHNRNSRSCVPANTQHTRTRRRVSAHAALPDSSTNGSPQKAPLNAMDSSDWNLLGFPTYLQNTTARPFPCEEPIDQTVDRRESTIWQAIRRQAQVDAAAEPLLSSFMYASILAHDSFEKALAFVLANRLANTTLLPTQLFEIFVEILQNDADVRCGALADVEAVFERDPSCQSLLQPLLYSKGYHAIQTHRIAHGLWCRGQRVMALALQSRSSEVFAVDIHPAARIGKGILLDHGTGVVIGETVIMGNNCSLLQNVTLGGTGKDMGDRHPKIADNVLIGANATVLGNIVIGRGAQIAAGSLVLKAVDPCTMVAGSPAKEVGKVEGNPAQTMSHWSQDCLPCGAPPPSSRRNTPQPPQQPSAHGPAPRQPGRPSSSSNPTSPRAPTTTLPLPTPQEASRNGGQTAQAAPPKTAPAPAAGKPAPGAGAEKPTPLQHWPLGGRPPISEPVLPGEGI